MTTNLQQELDHTIERTSQATQLDTLVQGYQLCARTEGKIDFERKTVTIMHLKRILKLFCPLCKSPLATKHRFCPSCASKIGDSIKKQQEKRRIRILPLDEDTLKMRKSYTDNNNTTDINGQTYLFGFNRHRAWQIVRNCAKQAGIPSLVNPETGRKRGVSPHRLRDAFSVHAIKRDDSGDGSRMLQEHLGQSVSILQLSTGRSRGRNTVTGIDVCGNNQQFPTY